MKRCFLLLLYALCLVCFGQLATVQGPDGTTWKNDKDARGFFQTGWVLYEYDLNGTLTRETEFASILKDTYKLREFEFRSGQPVEVFSKPWFTRAYLKYLYWFVLVLFTAFFSRIFINSRIYNEERGTDASPMYAFIGPLVTNNFGHSIACAFKFWWNTGRLKEENKQAAVISNVLSITALVLFFGTLIGLGLSGELH